MKIFGREPAAVSGVIAAVLAFLLSMNEFDLTQERVGLIMAVVTGALGIYTAWVTKHTLLGGVMATANAVFALFAGYNLDFMTIDQVTALLAIVPLVFGFFQRTQTSPVDAVVS